MGRLLVVDDDDLIAEMVCDLLISAGHGAGHCRDGREALDLMRIRPPHLLVLDCNMPNMSGIEVLRRMRMDPKLFKIPVLMLTARSGANDEHIARFDGVHDYVVKPFLAENLMQRVEALISSPNKGFHGFFQGDDPADHSKSTARRVL